MEPTGFFSLAVLEAAIPKSDSPIFINHCKGSSDQLVLSLTCQRKGVADGGQGITPVVMERCHWVEPTLVVQIKFQGVDC
jgi:hypothetical protein